MAINKKLNSRLDITLPKNQAEWVENNAKKLEISKSKFISWILARRIKQIVEELSIYVDPDYQRRIEKIDNDISNDISDEEIEKLLQKRKSYKDKQENKDEEITDEQIEALMKKIHNTKK